MCNPFSSIEYFREQFNQGLCDLLESQQLGPFILCLANATNDPVLFQQLKDKLKQQYDYFVTVYQASINNGTQIDAVEEDLTVFIKLQALGFSSIQLTQHRTESYWQCQFNQLRSFRPKRMLDFKHNGGIFTPFIESRFNFNKPFMEKECFWEGELNAKPLALFYNKYPFANLHGLLVPDRKACMPQLLTHEYHLYAWQLTQQLSENLPGMGLGYNSYGANASVNHLHFQMYIEEQELPVCQPVWLHNKGDIEYPVNVIRCEDMVEAWELIERLHLNKQPYNLLYMANVIYIMPRKMQGSVEVPPWNSGFTWYEISGAMLSFNSEDYNALQSDEIFKLLNELSV